MKWVQFSSLFLFLASSTFAADSLIIRNAVIIDGSGKGSYHGSVRIVDSLISDIGQLTPRPGETQVDARGLVLAPGFIDTHSHHDEHIERYRDTYAAVSQGITTIVVGQDGASTLPISLLWKKIQAAPSSVNIASFTGLGSLRSAVMGKDFKRPARPPELARMAALLEQDMVDGSLGLSTGLEYDPDTYAPTEEVIALAKVAAKHKGRYISHLRSEDRNFWQALEEIIRIGKEANIPVQISHLKLGMKSLWGQTPRLLARLNKARKEGVNITADVYPYTFWQSTLMVLFPDRNFTSKKAAATVLEKVVPPEGIVVTQFDANNAVEGKSIAEIARARKQESAQALMELAQESQALKAKTGREAETILGYSISETDITRILKWPHTNICSDGFLVDSHPRGRGAFPRVLGRYVREKKILSWEEAIYRMSGLSAQHMGLQKRGLIKPGYYADLVLFDKDTVGDRATAEQPLLASTGIERVYVNGKLVYESGKTTVKRPGMIIRR